MSSIYNKWLIFLSVPCTWYPQSALFSSFLMECYNYNKNYYYYNNNNNDTEQTSLSIWTFKATKHYEQLRGLKQDRCNEPTDRAATPLRARKVPRNVTARERMCARGSEYCCNVIRYGCAGLDSATYNSDGILTGSMVEWLSWWSHLIVMVMCHLGLCVKSQSRVLWGHTRV
jgi:hypothetical protein